MKNRYEIQQAHDLLKGLLVGEIPNPWLPECRPSLQAACDVLCWMLGHSHNPTFANNMEATYEFLRQKGFSLTDGPAKTERPTIQ